MKSPANHSLKIPVLMLAISAILICTGAKGGCGGSLEPEIERPTQGEGCPDTTPEQWESCELDAEQVCNYAEMSCCDAEGNLGYTAYTTFAQCHDGQWVIAMQRIGCAYGYWPNDCYDSFTTD